MQYTGESCAVVAGMRMEDSAISVEHEVSPVTVAPEAGAAAAGAAATKAGAAASDATPPAADGAFPSPSPPPVPEEKLEGRDLLEALKKQVRVGLDFLHTSGRPWSRSTCVSCVYEHFTFPPVTYKHFDRLCLFYGFYTGRKGCLLVPAMYAGPYRHEWNAFDAVLQHLVRRRRKLCDCRLQICSNMRCPMEVLTAALLA